MIWSSIGRGSIASDSPVYFYPRRRLYEAMPRRTFVCVRNYTPEMEGELALRKGQFVQGASRPSGFHCMMWLCRWCNFIV